MYKLVRFIIVFFVSSLLFLSSCQGNKSSDNDVDTIEIDSVVVEDKTVDYESPEMLAKFNTGNMLLPDSISYFDELNRINHQEPVNYSALDSLYAMGIKVSEPLYYESSGGGFGFGFKFSLRGGFRKTNRAHSSSTRETNALKMALRAYDHDITFDFPFKDKPGTESFDLIHFLLSRGANPNEEGLEPLYECIRSIASEFDREEKYIRILIEVYQFYGFDMKILDLSACSGEDDVLQYLISEGARNYNMNTFNFANNVYFLHHQKDELTDKGVVFDFSEIDGNTFPFDTDTLRLQLMLEMGLSPNHVTPKGVKLKDDFGPFCKESLTKTLNQYVEEHPEAE